MLISRRNHRLALRAASGILMLTTIWAWPLAAGEEESFLDSPLEQFDSTDKNEFIDVCIKLSKPCGIEVSDSKDLRADQKAPPIRMKKATPRQILEQHLKRLPNYRWLISNGVINLQPKKRTGEDLLSRKLETFNVNGVSSEKAAMKAILQAGIQYSYEPIGGGRYQVVSLDLKDITVREALNAIAKADGQVIWYFNAKDSGEGRGKLLMLPRRNSTGAGIERKKIKVEHNR